MNVFRLFSPRAAVAVLAAVLLSGCASNQIGYGVVGTVAAATAIAMASNRPAKPPAAEAQAQMPEEPDPVVDTQETYLGLVRQMQERSLWYASLAHLDALEKRWGAQPQTQLMRADALRQVGMGAESAVVYRSLIGTAQESAAYYGLGRLAGAQGNFALAVEEMERARQSNPTDAKLLNDLGYAYIQARRLPQAHMPLMQALQLSPDNPQVAMNLGLYLLASGQSEQAEALMTHRRMSEVSRAAIRQQAQQWAQGASPALAPAPALLPMPAPTAPSVPAEAAQRTGAAPLAPVPAAVAAMPARAAIPAPPSSPQASAPAAVSRPLAGAASPLPARSEPASAAPKATASAAPDGRQQERPQVVNVRQLVVADKAAAPVQALLPVPPAAAGLHYETPEPEPPSSSRPAKGQTPAPQNSEPRSAALGLRPDKPWP